MKQPASVPPTLSEWTFSPLWENPRVRRLVAAIMVWQVVTTLLIFLLYRRVFGYSPLHALLLTGVFLIISVAVTVTRALPTKRRLAINPFGLYYRISSSSSLRAIWADVESVGRYRWLWFPAEEGVFLGKGARMSTPLMGWYGKWGRFVPLTLFDPDWRTGEVGTLLRRYAPWLLDGSRSNSA